MSDDIVEKMNQAAATENHIHLKARIEELQARAEAAEALLAEAVKAGILEGAKTLQERGSNGWAEHLMAEYASVNVEAITELASDPETIARIVAQLKEGRG